MHLLDPFSADLPLWHPKRLTSKALGVLSNGACAALFNNRYVQKWSAAPDKKQISPETQSDGLTLTEKQRSFLLDCMREIEDIDGYLVELGAWEGETTRFLAQATNKKIVAVDRYFERWPPAAGALECFQSNTSDLENIELIRNTTYSAGKNFYGRVALIFIDAQHDFLNTFADFQAWTRHLVDSGICVFHDIDSPQFPGTRVAAALCCRNWEVVYRDFNIAAFRQSRNVRSE